MQNVISQSEWNGCESGTVIILLSDWCGCESGTVISASNSSATDLVRRNIAAYATEKEPEYEFSDGGIKRIKEAESAASGSKPIQTDTKLQRRRRDKMVYSAPNK